MRADLTALVGRDEELDLLLRRWSKAKRGEGQVVLLSGEAGIGKSRLTAALHGTPRDRAAHTLALFLLAAAHRQRALSDHRPDGTRRRTWRATTPRKRSSTSSTRCSRRPRPQPRTRHCLPRCCRCRTTDAIPRSTWRPQQRRQKTLEALIAQIEALARAQSGADGLRGCALDRSHEPGSVRSGR